MAASLMACNWALVPRRMFTCLVKASVSRSISFAILCNLAVSKCSKPCKKKETISGEVVEEALKYSWAKKKENN